MTELLSAKRIRKSFGKETVLHDIDVSIEQGEIVGLIGPNGAGKTTLLKAILGLAPYEGELNVLGMNPRKNRKELMKRISFIADTAILPSWLTVENALLFMKKIHPRFSIEKARAYLENSNISINKRIDQLSKGMITKTHLSLIMAINSELLVLDEPTLGLDIIKRKEFYNDLLGDYFDKNKTILITTHQVEEIENILTRAIFLHDGRFILDKKVDDINEQYSALQINTSENNPALEQDVEALKPIHKLSAYNGTTYTFHDQDKIRLAQFGKVYTPSLADLFVAMASH